MSMSPPPKSGVVVRSPVEIDGSGGEGGGQVLRIAIALANILDIPLVVDRIRAGRSKPGLHAQHCVGIRLATLLSAVRQTRVPQGKILKVNAGKSEADMISSLLQGDAIGSAKLTFTPSSLTSTETAPEEPKSRCVIDCDIGTAGSICLLLQAALPVALFAGLDHCRLVLRGGTNATMAPQFDYMDRVFLPVFLEQCRPTEKDCPISATVVKRGYYPRGGGEVQVSISSLAPNQCLNPIELTSRGFIEEISIRSFHAGKLPRHLAVQMANAAKECLTTELAQFLPVEQRNQVSYKVEVVTEKEAVGSGLGILIVARTSTGCRLAGSTIAAPGTRAETAGIDAAKELIQALRDGDGTSCVDEWLQDQLIIFMALAKGVSRMRTGSLSLHTQTAIWVASQLTNAKFTVQPVENGRIMDPISMNIADITEELRSTNLTSTQYGKAGSIVGTHLVTCEGIGFHR
jgi:RNA 3'-terminal phosphate cyclase (ATP)